MYIRYTYITHYKKETYTPVDLLGLASLINEALSLVMDWIACYSEFNQVYLFMSKVTPISFCYACPCTIPPLLCLFEFHPPHCCLFVVYIVACRDYIQVNALSKKVLFLPLE